MNFDLKDDCYLEEVLTDNNLACKKCWYMEDAMDVFADSSVGNRQLFLLFR
jgi:hypothetical protein